MTYSTIGTLEGIWLFKAIFMGRDATKLLGWLVPKGLICCNWFQTFPNYVGGPLIMAQPPALLCAMCTTPRTMCHPTKWHTNGHCARQTLLFHWISWDKPAKWPSKTENNAGVMEIGSTLGNSQHSANQMHKYGKKFKSYQHSHPSKWQTCFWFHRCWMAAFI